MSSYVIIPMVAVGFYFVLLLAFLGSRKSRIAYFFIIITGLLFIWNLASVLMRFQAPPSVKFWFHLSLAGVIYLPVSIIMFIVVYTGISNKVYTTALLIVTTLIYLTNVISDGVFLREPNVVVIEGNSSFIYDFTPLVAVIYVWMTACTAVLIILLTKYGKNGVMPDRERRFLFAGIITLFCGNLLVCLPSFSGFPIDMLTGIISAVFIYAAVTQNERFQLRLRMKKGVLRAVTVIILMVYCGSTLFTIYYSGNKDSLPWNVTEKSPIWILITVLIAAILFGGMELFIEKVFLRETELFSMRLKEFSNSVVRTLDLDTVISETQHFIEKDIKGYRVRSEFLSDIPDEEWLDDFFSEHGELISAAGLKFTPGTPHRLRDWLNKFEPDTHVMLLPVRDETKTRLLFILLPEKANANITREEKGYLESVASVTAVAAQNASMYEHIYAEARIDALTGIGNRKAYYEYMESLGEFVYPQSIIAMKLDDFKVVNRMYGYHSADLILKAVADLITSVAGDKGTAFRYTNTEILIVLNNMYQNQAFEICEEIRNKTMELKTDSIDSARKQLMITISGGVACRISKEISTDSLANKALTALSQAKSRGKNCSVMYDEGAPGESFAAYSFEEYEAMIRALLAAIDAKDHYTYNHSQNVSYYATELARAIGLDSDAIEVIRESGLLHDLGKLGISEQILKKPGRLTDSEYNVMKGHAEQAIEIVRHLPALEPTISAISGHHERYDGLGYPIGLKGENIPLPARILCIADSFDAMLSRRSYKDKYSLEYTIEELERCAGTQFDPRLVKIFIELVRNETIHIKFSDTK